MNNGTDYIALYRELGIEPDCTAEEFKRAYRRRVSNLHPDRAGDGGDGEETLKALNLGYAAALEFHRSHGRFPGARMRPDPAARPPRNLREFADEGRFENEGHAAPRGSRWLLLVLAVLLAVFVAMQFRTDGAGLAEVMPRATGEPVGMKETPRETRSLQVGQPAGDLLAMVGAPVSREDDGQQWLYGPSWVRVVCGQVVDWYSSPLQPLVRSRTRPGPGDTRVDYQPRPHCVESPLAPAAMAY